MAGAIQSMSEFLRQVGTTAGSLGEEKKTTLALIGGASAVAGLTWYLTRSSKGYKKKPGAFEIGSGAVDRTKVQAEVRCEAYRG